MAAHARSDDDICPTGLRQERPDRFGWLYWNPVVTLRAHLVLILAAMLMTGATFGGTGRVGIAIAGQRDAVGAERQAAADAARASALIADGRAGKAVRFAESAVLLSPATGAYRSILGQAYLRSGRFTSAREALSDALTLSPGDGRASLYLALARIGDGQWDAARDLLDANAQTIPAADRGLGFALAGDPAKGVAILIAAARVPESGVRTRQNLALALALAGRWPEARAIAAIDLSPADVDARILQWVKFAQPVSASDQVASLLRVVPLKDDGQPVALALMRAAPVEPQATQAALEGVPSSPTREAVKPIAVADAVLPVGPPIRPSILMAPMREVVQPLPLQHASIRTVAPLSGALARVAPIRAAVTPAGRGNWHVQLGAFRNANLAQGGWTQAKRRLAALADYTPNGVMFASGVGAVYRLSVGGLQRRDADALCRTYIARGGACFVRAAAGDRMAAWAAPASVQVAATTR